MSALSIATSCTPWVFCAVTAVRALIPKHSSAANVFRSAWMPAPPPESEPATVSSLGGGEASGAGSFAPSTTILTSGAC